MTLTGFNKPDNLKKEANIHSVREEDEAKNFFDYYPAFCERKKRKQGEKVDLRVLTLS